MRVLELLNDVKKIRYVFYVYDRTNKPGIFNVSIAPRMRSLKPENIGEVYYVECPSNTWPTSLSHLRSCKDKFYRDVVREIKKHHKVFYVPKMLKNEFFTTNHIVKHIFIEGFE